MMPTADDAIKAKIQQLTTLRKARGWSEETCAHELGITYSTLNRWERGEVLPRSMLVLNAIDQFIRTHQPLDIHDTEEKHP